MKAYALIGRRKQKSSGLSLDSIVIQSPYLRGMLREVFKDYRGLSMELKDLVLRSPFHDFFYRWNRFEKEMLRVQQGENETENLHAQLLQELITKEIQPHLEMRDDLASHDLVTFEYLWCFLEPDIELHAVRDGQDRLFRLTSSSYAEGPCGVYFNLQCDYVDCDGESFGYASTSLTIDSFAGVRKIRELETVPSYLNPKMESVGNKLQMRGALFEQLKGFHYLAYSGFVKLTRAQSDGNTRKQVDGRIIVDAKTFSTYNSGDKPRLRPLSASSASTVTAQGEKYAQLLEQMEKPRTHDREYEMVRRLVESRAQWHGRDEQIYGDKILDSKPLSSTEHRLCNACVRDYCLTSKQWVILYVDKIRDIKWSTDAFQRLILPGDFKELLLAFVQSQLLNTNSFDDIIQGKGKGIIILLTGSPGTGKTLTAEAVAEQMQRPLYSMGAGELGYSANDVEQNLLKILEMTAKWRAVLLIDECDIFLEQRSMSDMERNKLVSVFLRLLEYYKGVMFLTTNRVSTFDQAFKSRIHLTIHYPELGIDAKKGIWNTFIQQADTSSGRKSDISDDDLERLATMDINGREIKNIVMTAQLLATSKEIPLNTGHISTVMRVSGR